MNDTTKIGKKLRRVRILQKYTQEDIASMCEMSLYDLIDIEKGNKHPGDATLKLLLKLYGLTEEEFLRDNFVDHKNKIRVINYVQIVLSFLMILAYVLPFTYHYYGPQETIVPDYPGYMLLFNYQHGYPYVVSIVFMVFVVQFILHLFLYTKLQRFSNIFKVIFLMMNVSSFILLYIDFVRNYNLISTLVVFLILLGLHMVLTIYDFIKYPLNHDSIQDIKKMRRLFVLLILMVYLLFYIFLLFEIILNYYPIGFLGILFYILFGSYLISYFVLRKTHLESRKFVTLYLLVPPVFFLLFNVVAYIQGEESLTDPGSMVIILMLFLPVLIINIDYFIQLIVSFFKKGDILEVKE